MRDKSGKSRSRLSSRTRLVGSHQGKYEAFRADEQVQRNADTLIKINDVACAAQLLKTALIEGDTVITVITVVGGAAG